jgi:hypothetical protein
LNHGNFEFRKKTWHFRYRYVKVWKNGDANMPDNVSYVVNAARDELLLRALEIPDEALCFKRKDK